MTMANEHDKKKPEDTVELSVDDLEEASGGVIVETEDGRYLTMDEFNGRTYYVGNDLGFARQVAKDCDVSARVMTESEYERRSQG